MSEFNKDGVRYSRRLKKLTSLNHVPSDDIPLDMYSLNLNESDINLSEITANVMSPIRITSLCRFYILHNSEKGNRYRKFFYSRYTKAVTLMELCSYYAVHDSHCHLINIEHLLQRGFVRLQYMDSIAFDVLYGEKESFPTRYPMLLDGDILSHTIIRRGELCGRHEKKQIYDCMSQSLMVQSKWNNRLS